MTTEDNSMSTKNSLNTESAKETTENSNVIVCLFDFLKFSCFFFFQNVQSTKMTTDNSINNSNNNSNSSENPEDTTVRKNCFEKYYSYVT